MLKPDRVGPVLLIAGFLFAVDALIGNAVALSFLVAALYALAGLPVLIFKPGLRRPLLRNIGILAGAVVLVAVMVRVNAHVAPRNAQRLIAAIERHRAETGVYPNKLDDLVPRFIDRVPCAQYTLGGVFFYAQGGTADPPMLWYNPHQMDHRIYRFETRDWGYLG